MSQLSKTVPVLFGVSSVLLFGCSRAGELEPQVLRYDSAGIEIVNTTRARWTETDGWQVFPEPLVSIGKVSGEEPYLLGDVVGAVRLRDGTVVVADGQPAELRFYDSTGVFMDAVGGRGEGPGEFQSLHALWRCEGDHLCAYDRDARSFQVWNSNRDFVRRAPVMEPHSDRPRRPFSVVFSPEAEGFLGIGWQRPKFDYEEGEVYQAFAPLWLFDGEGDLLRELGEFLSAERVYSGRLTAPHPFGRRGTFALAPERVIIGTGEAFELLILDLRGSPVQIFRGPPQDLAVTDELVDEYRRADLSGDAAGNRSTWEAAGYPVVEAVPAVTKLLVDPDGNLWAKRFSKPEDSEVSWAVFAADGEFLGHLRVPDGLTLTDIGRDWIVGIRADDLGVERVEVFGLGKK